MPSLPYHLPLDISPPLITTTGLSAIAPSISTLPAPKTYTGDAPHAPVLSSINGSPEKVGHDPESNRGLRAGSDVKSREEPHATTIRSHSITCDAFQVFVLGA